MLLQQDVHLFWKYKNILYKDPNNGDIVEI